MRFKNSHLVKTNSIEWTTKVRFDGKSAEYLKNHNAAKNTGNLAITPTTNIFILYSYQYFDDIFFILHRLNAQEMMVMLRLEQGKEIKKKQFRSLQTLLLEMTDKFLQKSVECIKLFTLWGFQFVLTA